MCIQITDDDGNTSDGVVISLSGKKKGKKGNKVKGVAVTATIVNQKDAPCCEDCLFQWYNVSSCETSLTGVAGAWMVDATPGKGPMYDTTPKGNGAGSHFVIDAKWKDYIGGVIVVYNTADGSDGGRIGCGTVGKRTKETKCSVKKGKY